MIGNLPTEHARSPWAVVIVLLVILLFGWFWLLESSRLKNESHATPMAIPVVENKSDAIADELDLSTLEANAVNIAIPSFEELF